jgi:N-acetylglucosaminyldiphosphoundecaprenol N-acetyl-beta-D-mannosaminyltransferase
MSTTPPPPLPEPPVIILLGIPFHDVTMEETLAYIDGMVARRTPGYFATANLDFAAQASQDVELQRILFDAELVLCDGTPLIWASKWIGAPLRERVAGSDLLPRLFEHSEKKGHRLFFLGATEDVLEIAVQKCAEKYPNLKIAGTYSPPFAKLLEINNEEISRRVKAAQADLLLVAMGCPKQEKWIYMHYKELGVPMSVGIGATFDFIAGKFSRAPVWMRKCGLEWVFRLMQEPRRLFNRYLFDLMFFASALKKERQMKAQSGRAAKAEAVTAPIELPAATGKSVAYKWEGRIDAAAVHNHKVEAITPTPSAPSVVLDCGGVTFMDSSGLGLLMRVFRACKAAGGTLVIYQPSTAVNQMLSLLNLDRLLAVAHTEEDVQDFLRAVAPAKSSGTGTNAGEVKVTLSGDLVAATVPECLESITKAWEHTPTAIILQLDLAQVPFMDSSGLGLLVKSLKMAKTRPGGRLVLVHPSENVRNVVKLAKLEAILGMEAAA